MSGLYTLGGIIVGLVTGILSYLVFPTLYFSLTGFLLIVGFFLPFVFALLANIIRLLVLHYQNHGQN